MPPTGLSPPAPDDATAEAARLLVEFGVWRSRAGQLARTLNLTPERVTRACAALRAEAERGAAFTNPAAVLAGRLVEGWEPPEIEEAEEEHHAPETWECEPPPQPKRRPLPPVAGRWGGEQDAYAWFEQLKDELALQLTRETFDAWLRPSELVDYRPPEGDTPGVLTIRLHSQPAYEWVTRRLHPVVGRLVSSMVAGEVVVEYTGPAAPGENEGESDERATAQGGVYKCIHPPYTNVYT
jgi:hypothetical protein